MALPWIKVAANLPNHGKSLQLRVELQSEWAWGHVVLLWMYASQFVPEGRFEGRGCEDIIEEAARWRGKRGAFVEAAERCGFLDPLSAGYAIHDWEDWAGAHIEKKKADKERKRRERHPDGPVDSPRDVTRKSRGQSSGQGGGQGEEKGGVSRGKAAGPASKDSRDFETRDSSLSRSSNHERSDSIGQPPHVSALASDRSSAGGRFEAEEMGVGLTITDDVDGTVTFIPRRTVDA